MEAVCSLNSLTVIQVTETIYMADVFNNCFDGEHILFLFFGWMDTLLETQTSDLNLHGRYIYSPNSELKMLLFLLWTHGF